MDQASKNNWDLKIEPTIGKTIVINSSLMTALQEGYGEETGEKVYLHMQKDAKPGFIKGLQTAKRHGHAIKYTIKHTKKLTK